MNGDPWNWNVSDVQQFFRDHAHSLLTDRPHAKLPDLTNFAQNIAYHQVDGATLLQDVDHSLLRTDFGIDVLGQRSAIIHCIAQLRNRSSSWRYQFEPLSSRVLSSHTPALTPVLPPATLDQNPATPTVRTPISGSHDLNVLAQEEPEIDVQPTKKRKRAALELVEVQTSKPTRIHHDTGLYLPPFKSTLDEHFFGNYTFGQEIHEHEDPRGMRLEPGEDAQDCFQFFHVSDCTGRSHIMGGLMKHFQLSGWEDGVRGGGKVHHVQPYREPVKQRMSCRGRDIISLTAVAPISALTVKSSSGSVRAVRERAAFVRTEYDYDIEDLMKIDEQNPELDPWILRFYQNPEENVEVGSADTGSNPDILEFDTEGNDEEGSDDFEMAEEEEIPGIGAEKVLEVLNNYIDQFVLDWRTKELPRLQEKTAYKEWRKMGASKALRDVLIERERCLIKGYEKRLRDMKNAVTKDPQTEADLKRCCGNLEVTLGEREKSIWKISVYQNPRQPHRTIIQRNKTKQSYATHRAAEPSSFTRVDDNDQLDFEPTTPTRVHADAASDEDTLMSNAVDTPADDGNDAEDEISDRSDTEDSIDDAGEARVIDLTLIDSSPVRPLPALTLARSTRNDTKMEEVSPRPDAQEQSSDELPSPSQLVAANALQSATPQKLLKSKSTKDDPIVVSSDDNSIRTPIKLNRADKERLYEGEGLDSTPGEIQSWDYKILKKRNLRVRLLIKLLSQISLGHRELIMQSVGKDSKTSDAFVRGIREAISLLAGLAETGEIMGEEDENVHFLQARLALAWYLSDHTVLSGDIEEVYRHKDALNRLVVDATQLPQFATMLKSIFNKSSSLFKEALQSSKSAGKKTVKPLDEAGVRQRIRARQRQTQAQLHTETNSANRHDASGSEQVIVNPFSSTPIYVQPQIARQIKPHQVTGVQFMWREITSCAPNNPGLDLQEPVDDVQQGCVLAHTMGLGKTCQTITLLVAICQTLAEKDEKKLYQLPESLRPAEVLEGCRRLRVLVLCPPTLIPNWEREIQHWDPWGDLGVVRREESTPSGRTGRGEQLAHWANAGGVLLMGYQFFQILAGDPKDASDAENSTEDESLVGTLNTKSRKARVKTTAELKKEEMARDFLRNYTELVVADEAQQLKNQKALVSVAASLLSTKVRIALTGTPMANSVDEYYSLVSWVAPGYLGPKDEFNANYGNPIKDGNAKDADYVVKRRAQVKLKILQKQIAPKVDRQDITALKGELQPKVEFIIKVSLTQEQAKLYNRTIDAINRTKTDETSNVQIFGWLGVLGLLTAHPAAFKDKFRRIENATKRIKAKKVQPHSENNSPEPGGDDDEDRDSEDVYALGFSKPMADAIIEGVSEDIDPVRSAKTALLLDIVRLSKSCGDKVLVFSHRLRTLDYLKRLLDSEGVENRKINGEMSTKKREDALAQFTNTRNGVDVMLICTRAGGTGLNMQVANRVVIFDSDFNPMHETQAVGRAYRTGQKKPVFVYRLVSGGTFEVNIENMQNFKISLTDRVIDHKNVKRNAHKNVGKWLFPSREEPPEDLAQWEGKDAAVMDHILRHRAQMSSSGSFIRRIITMETLQQEEDDVEFTAEEEMEVQQADQDWTFRKKNYSSKSNPEGTPASTQKVRPGPSHTAAGPTRNPPASTMPARPQNDSAHFGGSMPRSGFGRILQTMANRSMYGLTGAPPVHGLPEVPQKRPGGQGTS